MRIHAVLIAFAALLPMSAAATECTSDFECPEGQACEWSGSCPPCAGDGGGAGGGEECPPCTESGTCVEATGILLVGPACGTDADCPMAFACVSVEVGATTCGCACAECPVDVECPPCECEPCEPTGPITENRCVFVPATCADDSACADGFTCAVSESCESGGSSCGCAGCEAGTECPPCECPPPEEPVCHVTGGWCFPPIDTPCTTDASCSAGWTCEAGPMSGGGCDCACPACEGPDCPPCECGPCEEPATESVCLPPGWGDVLDELIVVGGDDDAGGGGTSEEGSFQFPDGTPAPTNGRGDDPAAGSGDSSSSEDEGGLFGCSAAQGAPAFFALGLALAGLLLRRRR